MTRPQRFATAPEDRIPLAQKIAYASGMFVNSLQAAALVAMTIILNLGLRMDPVLVGIVGFVPRIIDALSDPVLGYISDKTNSRWGRRRPYIFCGALISGIVFALMWQLPSGYSEMFYFGTCLTGFSSYFLMYTLFAAPLIALGYELTPDYHERTRLQALANTFGQLAWIGSPWFYAFMASELFDNTVAGVRTLALGVGGAMCILGIAPAIVCRERIGSRSNAIDSTLLSLETSGLWNHSKNFFHEMVSTFKCRPFIRLCAATFLIFNGFQLGTSFSLYVLIYYVFGGDNKAAGTLFGMYGTFTACCTLVVISLATWMSSKIGKRKTFMMTISLSLIGYALKWFGFNPDRPYLLLVACPFVAFGVGSLFTLMGSMVADVCDYDELQGHQRREGIFGAIYWWMVKVGMAIAGLLAGILLKASGFHVALSSQSEGTLLLLRLFDVGIPMVTSAIAIAVVATYPITEAAAHDIRTQLEARRGRLRVGPNLHPEATIDC